MKDAAIKFIIENPARFIELSYKRFVRLFNIVPNYIKKDTYKNSIKIFLIHFISAISMIAFTYYQFWH